MNGYKIEIEQTCTYSERENVAYGEWKESYVNKAPPSILKEEKYPDVTTTLDFDNESVGYIVWAEWSSGNSFGWGTNKYTDVIGLFKDKKSAEELANYLKSLEDKCVEYDFVTLDMQKFKGYVSWNGYFERLSDIHVDKVIIYSKEPEDEEK